MSQRTYGGLLVALALVGLVADQASKYGVFGALYQDGRGGEWDCVPGVFKILAQYKATPVPAGWRSAFQSVSGSALPRVNEGALFGLGNDPAYAVYANAFFASVSVVAAAAICYWATRPSTAADGPLCAALGLILAGTLGNLFDRVVFWGVRDFLYFYWIEWPVFNVADCCLVCGAGLLLLQAFLSPAPESARRKAELATAE